MTLTLKFASDSIRDHYVPLIRDNLNAGRDPFHPRIPDSNKDNKEENK